MTFLFEVWMSEFVPVQARLKLVLTFMHTPVELCVLSGKEIAAKEPPVTGGRILLFLLLLPSGLLCFPIWHHGYFYARTGGSLILR